MKFKNIMLIMLLVSVLTVGTVSASDNNMTDEVSRIVDADDFDGLDVDNSDATLDDESNDLLGKDNENDKLSHKDDEGNIAVQVDSSYSTSNNNTTCLTVIASDANNVDAYGLKASNAKIRMGDYSQEDYDEYDDLEEELGELVKIKAPKVKVKYKAKKYFKITIKDQYGRNVKYQDVFIDVWTGKKVKTYLMTTNSKGIIKFSTKKLKVGTHKVKIELADDPMYYGEKYSKIIVKKTKSVKKTTKKSKYKVISITAKKHFKTKKSGKFKVKSIIFDMWRPYYGDYKYIDTWLYKKGKMVEQTKYKTKYYVNGKWTKWMTFEWGTNHHRYPVYDADLTSIKIKVKVRRY